MWSKAHTGALRASRSWVCGTATWASVSRLRIELTLVSGSPEAEPLLTVLNWGWWGQRKAHLPLLEGGGLGQVCVAPAGLRACHHPLDCCGEPELT